MDELYADSPAGLEVIPLDTLEQVTTASRLLGEVWGGDTAGMPVNLLRALAYSGNYAVGVFDGERMVAASVAFFGDPARSTMHSHITGVLPAHQGRGIGRMLKQHQREWAHARGLHRITWTFDPLVARNAHFNLTVLGARVTDYHVNHYGPMDDGVNRGDETDRLTVAWMLYVPVPDVEPADIRATIRIPDDIASMRRDAPEEAAQWRRDVRDAFVGHLADGLVVAGFDDRRGYLLVRAAAGDNGAIAPGTTQADASP